MIRNKISDLKIISYLALGIACFGGITFLIAWMARENLKSQPEYQQSVLFLSENPTIRTRFGEMTDLQLDNAGTKLISSKSFLGKDRRRSGNYQFIVKGLIRSGTIRIYWDSSPYFTVQKIDEVMPDGSLVKLWTLK